MYYVALSQVIGRWISTAKRGNWRAASIWPGRLEISVGNMVVLATWED